MKQLITRLIGFKKPHWTPGIRIRVLDESGKVLKERRAMTLTKWGMTAILTCISNDTSYTVTDTSNASFATAIASDLVTWQFHLSGLGVGTSTTAFGVTDHELITKIVSGSSSGQLQYGSATVSTSIAITGNVANFIVSQPFTNASGADITVNEVACYGQLRVSGSTQHTIMWDRTLFSFVVPNGQSRTLQYTFSNS